MTPEKEKIISFVKRTLGCECPDDVFRFVDCRKESVLTDGLALRYRMNIGNRLLIYVIEAKTADFVRENLRALVSFGKAERDMKGFNRFRLVLATDGADDIRDISERIFGSLEERDEKVHLHIVQTNALEI